MKKGTGPPQNQIRVMLVDDHPVMREGLRTLLKSQDDLNVVAEARDGASALRLIHRANPDVVLMDMSMPEMSGLEATRRLKKIQPSAKIIGLTLFEQNTYLEELLAAGATGYMLKTSPREDLIQAVRTVAAGGTVLDAAISRASSAVAKCQSTAASPAAVDRLSEDELAVAKLVAAGHTNSEIAATLGFTAMIVEARRSAAMQKLGAQSRAELVRVAAQLQWRDG